MSPALAPLRVTPNLWHAFGGVWRLSFRRLISPPNLGALAVILAVLVLLLFTLFQRGDTRFYVQWTVGFYLTFLLPILAFLSGAGAMRDEMKPESVDYTLTRPLRRPVLVVFKFIAHVACIQITYMLALAIVVGVGVYRQIPDIWSAAPWFLLGQLATVTAFAAFGFCSAALTGRYFFIGLLYAAIIEVAIGNIPTQLNRLSMTKQVRMLLHPVLVTINPTTAPGDGALTAVAVLAGFSLAMLVVAAIVFSQLEMAGARPSET